MSPPARASVRLVIRTAFSARGRACTYDVTENGHNGPIDFTVRFSDTAVTEITTGHNLESEGVGLWALDKLSHDIIAYQTLNLDAVTESDEEEVDLGDGEEDTVNEDLGDDMNDMSEPEGATE